MRNVLSSTGPGIIAAEGGAMMSAWRQTNLNKVCPVILIAVWLYIVDSTIDSTIRVNLL